MKNAAFNKTKKTIIESQFTPKASIYIILVLKIPQKPRSWPIYSSDLTRIGSINCCNTRKAKYFKTNFLWHLSRKLVPCMPPIIYFFGNFSFFLLFYSLEFQFIIICLLFLATHLLFYFCFYCEKKTVFENEIISLQTFIYGRKRFFLRKVSLNQEIRGLSLEKQRISTEMASNLEI